ncbi:MAG: type II secretion system protein [Candidatus Wallbacteria bacterium]
MKLKKINYNNKTKTRFFLNKAFTIIELMVAFVLVAIVLSAGYQIFFSSYFFVRSSEEKLQNVHAVSVLLEGLRYELSSLPDINNLKDGFSDNPGKWVSEFSYERQTTDEKGEQKKLVDISYKHNPKTNEVIKTIASTSQSFGQGRISSFKIMHNYDAKTQKFPVYIRIMIDTINEQKSQVHVEATIYPRLINKNLVLKSSM